MAGEQPDGETDRVFVVLPPPMRRTLTWDRGKAMSQHLQLSTTVGIDVYFCSPASPWQRGSNENASGVLRDYFPKSTDLRVHTAAELNDRPRKTLAWQTPDALQPAAAASRSPARDRDSRVAFHLWPPSR